MVRPMPVSPAALTFTGDNWNAPQKVTVPIYLLAGNNTIRFGNPDDSVFDVDSIRI